jgi:hypothetical protein
MIFGRVMSKICHGVGCRTVAIFGGCAMWLFFQSLLASNLSLRAIYPFDSKDYQATYKQGREAQGVDVDSPLCDPTTVSPLYGKRYSF